MAYSDKVIDHYENPQNMGSLDKADPQVGTGLVGAPACGDVMKLQLKINADGVIEDAKFKTFGCGSAIASSSLVTTMVKGKSIDDAEQVSNAEIARDASLTGTLGESAKVLVAAYNRILQVLRQMDCGLDELLFAEAADDTSLDEIGVLSEHLSKFLEVKFGCGTLDEDKEEEGMADLLKKLLTEKENLEKQLAAKERQQSGD